MKEHVPMGMLVGIHADEFESNIGMQVKRAHPLVDCQYVRSYACAKDVNT
jgi:hypothetical protein